MTTGAGPDSERFAAAVEHGRPRAGTPAPGDEQLDRELELVALLRESRASLAPSADASARMRARVMAAAATMAPSGAPSASAERQTEPTPAAAPETAAEDERTNVVSIGSARGRHRFPARLRAGNRPSGSLGIGAAAALVVLAVTGGGALFSQGALPGDTLYGVKQTTESGLIALTPESGRAQRQLDIAATRIDEVQALNRSTSSGNGSEISQALRGFNEQAAAGSRMWLANGKSSELAEWADAQSKRLAAMRSSMPTGAQSDADKSMRMLEQMQARADALNSRQGCDTITSGESDQFGPVPAKGSCSVKESGSPSSRQVVPNTPTRERVSTPSEPGSRGNQLPTTGGAKPDGPNLQLPRLPGSDSNPDDIGPIPDREPTNGTEPVPGESQQPGLDLPLLPN